MTPDYASLDAAIVKAIRDGADTFMVLVVRLGTMVGHWRLIDRRLQSLRKRGLIVYNNGRWSAVDKV